MAGVYHQFRFVSSPHAVPPSLFVRLPTLVFPVVVDGSQLKWQTNEHKVDEMVEVRYIYIYIYNFLIYSFW